ncbi:MAG: Fe-S protein assembly co-chaperone HscB [Armatimonadetes bacterium]|nr:Fe-S protein assembly co-chaperone HscB [Armatimonadota bacterium]
MTIPVSAVLAPLLTTTGYFDLLGVPVAVDDATLTRRFRELSRIYHPDRHANADAETQTVALDATALLNDAYRTLHDPFTRAEYLLRSKGGVSLNDLQKNAKPPQDLLMQVMELQEALMEYQEARLDDDTGTMRRLTPTLTEARTEFTDAYETLAGRLSGLFAAFDSGDDRAGVLASVAEVVGTRGYLRRVLTNLNGTLTDTDSTGG